MALLAALPQPKREYQPLREPANEVKSVVAIGIKEAPPYLRRQNFVPRRAEDFGDGGSFPEVHVAQYPLDMGRPDGIQSNKTLAVTVNSEGSINYDAILRQGANRDKIIYSDHKSLLPKVDELEKDMSRPDEEEIEETTKDTMAALQRVVEKKLSATQTKSLPNQPGAAQMVKYTPSQQGAAFASGAKQRIIKMQDLPVDPLEPPKFRHTKVPRGAGSPPVPVMHSPPRPVTVRDMQDWKIPPCISNWKNPKGYTIPLDKRLAADGRGLEQKQISDKFAGLTEALYIAEQKARESVEMRARMQREMLQKQKEEKERELRELALRARMERAGGLAGRSEGAAVVEEDNGLPPPPVRDDNYESAEEREARRKRDEIREERRRERERERRLEAKEAHGSKKSKLTRDRERDIGEKMALGMANVNTGGEVMYDQRLFNQEHGMAAGFGEEDSYNLYDKPLFADRGTSLYRARGSEAQDDVAALRTEKFRPDKGFQGAEGDGAAGPRSGPVEFERKEVEADPFGLDAFLSEVKTGRKKNTLDSIGQGGHMRAAGGGGGSYEDGGMGRRVHFQRGGGA